MYRGQVEGAGGMEGSQDQRPASDGAVVEYVAVLVDEVELRQRAQVAGQLVQRQTDGLAAPVRNCGLAAGHHEQHGRHASGAHIELDSEVVTADLHGVVRARGKRGLGELHIVWSRRHLPGHGAAHVGPAPRSPHSDRRRGKRGGRLAAGNQDDGAVPGRLPVRVENDSPRPQDHQSAGQQGVVPEKDPTTQRLPHGCCGVQCGSGCALGRRSKLARVKSSVSRTST